VGLHELATLLEAIARLRSSSLILPATLKREQLAASLETPLQRYTPDCDTCIANSNDRLRAA